MQQRRDDAVGGAGDPAGSAVHQDVAIMQIERVAPVASGVRTATCVHGALGVPVVPLVKCNRAGLPGWVATVSNVSPGLRHQRGEVPVWRGWPSRLLLTHQQGHGAGSKRAIAQLRHLALVQQVGGDQHRPSPMPIGWRSAPGRRRRTAATPAARLQAAERRDVQLRDAPGQHEDTLAAPPPGSRSTLAEAAGEARQLAVADITERVLTEETEGDALAQGHARGARPPHGRC